MTAKDKVKKLFKNNNLTLKKFSEQSGYSVEKLKHTFNSPLNDWKFGVIMQLAYKTGHSIDKVCHYLSPKTWTLEFSDDLQTLQGVPIQNTKEYKIIKSSVITECTEGWKPNANDIRYLVKHYNQSNGDMKKTMKKAQKKFGF